MSSSRRRRQCDVLLTAFGYFLIVRNAALAAISHKSRRGPIRRSRERAFRRRLSAGHRPAISMPCDFRRARRRRADRNFDIGRIICRFRDFVMSHIFTHTCGHHLRERRALQRSPDTIAFSHFTRQARARRPPPLCDAPFLLSIASGPARSRWYRRPRHYSIRPIADDFAGHQLTLEFHEARQRYQTMSPLSREEAATATMLFLARMILFITTIWRFRIASCQALFSVARFEKKRHEKNAPSAAYRVTLAILFHS